MPSEPGAEGRLGRGDGGRRAHLDLASGIAGDMLLAALVDAGVDLRVVNATLAGLGIAGLHVSTSEVRRGGLRGRLLTVHADESPPPLRGPADLARLVDGAGLDLTVRRRVGRVLDRLARAEADVHGCPVEDVHFHEVGAVDTLADVVGVCVALDDLGVDEVTCGSVATGGGTVATSHGVLPVPAPAVLTLLRGLRITNDGVEAELTTPTGAALLAELVSTQTGSRELTVAAVGYGAGRRELPHPNLLRITLGARPDDTAADDERLLVVEATVDDLPAELVPWVLDRLRGSGALDAWAVPAVMKKGRPGHTLTALAGPEHLGTLSDVLFREATTLGVRWHPVDRRALTRTWRQVVVDGCTIRVKLGWLGDDVVTVAPESDDVLTAADQTGRPARAVHAAAVRAASDDLRSG